MTILENLKKGSTIVVSGDVEYDRYASEIVLSAKSIGTAEKIKVVDNAPKKRVELHMHTNMSMMDGMTTVEDLIKTAHKFIGPSFKPRISKALEICLWAEHLRHISTLKSFALNILQLTSCM